MKRGGSEANGGRSIRKKKEGPKEGMVGSKGECARKCTGKMGFTKEPREKGRGETEIQRNRVIMRRSIAA